MNRVNSITVIILLASISFSCAGNSSKWKIGKNTINSSGFELQAGQSAITDGNFKNFDFKTRVTHSAGAKASLWFHSDATLTKGYSILIGNPADDRRRSGSLASIRNLYKPVPDSFDLEVMVKGKNIVVMINGWIVVDYLEPADPYRTAANTKQLLSNGLIGFHVENGTLNIENADITSLEDNLPNYPEGRQPIDFFASPTRLSPTMMKDYDKYWTDARISQLVNALKKNNVAMEINSFTKVPSAKIIKAAKAAGVKFTLGTNNERVEELSRLAYSLQMVEECGLTIDDMWFPKAKERY